MKNENSNPEQEILRCKHKLKELAPYIKTSEAIAQIYNQTLVEKAVLTRQYGGNSQKGRVFSFGKIKNILSFNKQKKRICDYFMKNV